jgi:Holliday junction resolvase RusA-like endonuclease
MKRTPHGGIIHSSKKLMPWRELVAWQAQEAWQEKPADCPVALHLLFKFSRPKGHYGTGKNSMVLKPSSPARHIKKPDLDKLIRAIEDALDGVIYVDDSRVDEVHARKEYCELEEAQGVLIVVEIFEKGA